MCVKKELAIFLFTLFAAVRLGIGVGLLPPLRSGAVTAVWNVMFPAMAIAAGLALPRTKEK